MKHLKLFESSKSQTFLERHPDIEDVLTPMFDLSTNPRSFIMYIQDGEMTREMPNMPEVSVVNIIVFPFRETELDHTIELLQNFKSLKRRLEIYSDKSGYDVEWLIDNGVKIMFVRNEKNTDYISFGDEFRKMIDTQKGYWVVRDGQIAFDRFRIPNDSRDNISHGENGNYFTLRDFKNSMSDGTDTLYRSTSPEGSEKNLFLKLFRKHPTDEMEMLTKIREKLMSDMNRYSERRRMLTKIKFFDDRMSKLYPKYKGLNLSDKDKDFKFRIND
jgi:hypothetical protein